MVDITQLLSAVVLPYMAFAVLLMGLVWKINQQQSKNNMVLKICVIALLLVMAITGITMSTLQSNMSYYTWLRGLFSLDPIHYTNWIVELHYISLCFFMILLPFSRLSLFSSILDKSIHEHSTHIETSEFNYIEERRISIQEQN